MKGSRDSGGGGLAGLARCWERSAGLRRVRG